MVSVGKVLVIWVWKSVLLRKRNWLMTIIEIAVVFSCTYFVYWFNDLTVSASLDISDSSEDPELLEYPFRGRPPVFLAYAPSQSPNDILMKNVVMTCFLPKMAHENGKMIEEYTSTTEIEDWLKSQTAKEMLSIALIFDETDFDSKNFKYTIRSNLLPGLLTNIIKDTNNADLNFYEQTYFLALQSCVDTAIMQRLGIPPSTYHIGIGPLPKQSFLAKITMIILDFAVIISTMFLVASVLADVIQEKASGIKEMMKLMGISSWLIWIQYLIYNMLVYLPIALAMAVFLTRIDPPVIKTSFVIVWLLLVLFFLNTIFFFFFLSCFFNNSKLANSILIVAWFLANTSCIQINPLSIDQLYFQVLICFALPFVNVSWALKTIVSFESYAEEFSMSSMFTVGYTGSKLPVGLSMIIFVWNSILLFLVTLNLDALRPGPYGIAKHPLYICDLIRSLTKRSSETNESFEPKSSLPKNFESPPKNAKVGIEIRGLCKVYGRVRKEVAVQNVDLDIYKGEIMVLLGHNGAGKTTTMSMITGMFSATSGTIKVDGKLLEKNLSKFRGSLGLCTQHDLYFPKLSVIDHLVFFGVLRGMSFSKAKNEGMRLLHMLNIQDKASSLGRKLSGGMKRRLCLANSLVGDPQVLILDEPTSGLDPETRRVIWNILLGFRGSRTILITTHFMEEADVLGDRIAIMHHGRVICCGSTLFLKKIYGSGYNVHVLKKPDAKEAKIFSSIQSIVPDLQMRTVSPTQLDFIIKETYVDRFPAMFADLERSTANLGITGVSVTSATLEEVFLKVAEESDTTQRDQKDTNYMYDEFDPVKGFSLFLQRLEAVIKKRLIHIKRKWFSYLFRSLLSCLLFVYLVIYFSKYKPPNVEIQKPLLMSLGEIYPGSVNPIKAVDNPKLKDSVVNILKREKADVQFLSDDENINEYTKALAKDSFMDFLNKALLGITVSQTELIVQYQSLLNLHMPAIAVNLIPNILMKSHDIDGSIQVVNHPYVLVEEVSECPSTSSSKYTFINQVASVWRSYTVIALIFCIPLYTGLITEELSNGFKHQQMFAGLNSLPYWCFNFMFDLVFYLVILCIWILIIVAVGSQHILIDNYDLFLLVVLTLALNGLSNIAFVYLLSYVIRGNKTEVMIVVFNIVFLIGAVVLSLNVESLDFNTLMIIYCVCSLNPIFATAMSVGFILDVIAKRYICRVCQQSCEVENTLLEMPSDTNRRTILVFTIFLSTIWILYGFILFLLDSNLYSKLFLLFRYSGGNSIFYEDDDDDVVTERKLVETIKKDGVETPLLVDKLVKKYLFGPKAVDGVTFFVERGECFGLLGVNGAGKTTTFKILTGEVLPDRGHAESSNVSVFSRKAYSEQIGYCPQFDACLKVMTGRETLKTIALIRGVPRREVNSVVTNWLKMMGIEEHGDKKTGAYSGGTRRKLSTAMAFMGEPVVVLLDEPTTGVDPVSRRKLWSVIQARQRAGQAVVLTSHSMEECEALCTRLTIMREGRMRCIGTVEYLKNKFRLGFVVDVKLLNPTPNQTAQFKMAFTKTFSGARLSDESPGMVQFTVLDAERPLSNTFAEMLRLKDQYSFVQDFIVNNTTLEQLFLSFAHK